jgi:hypothetical protein
MSIRGFFSVGWPWIVIAVILLATIRVGPVWGVYYISLDDGELKPIATANSYESPEVFCKAIAEHLGPRFVCKETTWWDRTKMRWETRW